MPEGSSFVQSGHKRRLISFGESAHKSAKSSAQAYAKASARGSASVVIETNVGTASSYAKATVNVQGGRASAKIESTSLGRGSATGQSSSQKKKTTSLVHSKNKMT
ncbi:uncharacterized protein C2845_PM02G20720 [Panicum miliaceum]|uniref:Uncharacterized protein n=1 Tax=Panicum miliaceum TaxID=4540 RepID=A0A3L6SC73_PANMI|nr:uncharacterized protein C2845_PM02G20720 [Panicum miliaceum]